MIVMLRFLLLVGMTAVAFAVRADAPLGRYTIGADTVLDNRTRLTWQRTADAETFSLADAVSYCAGLAIAGGGWRLPNIVELQSIVDVTRRPSIDPVAFPNTMPAVHWSSSVTPFNSSLAWAVWFSYGSTDYVGVVGDGRKRRVRCVR